MTLLPIATMCGPTVQHSRLVMSRIPIHGLKGTSPMVRLIRTASICRVSMRINGMMCRVCSIHVSPVMNAME